MHLHEWKQKREQGHIRRLGPFLALASVLFVLLFFGLVELLPPPETGPPADRVALRPLSADQWMKNKSVKQKPRAQRLAQKKPSEPEKKKDEKQKKDPPKPTGQIVDIAMPEKQETPDKADKLSQYDSKTEHETKARKRRASDKVQPKESRKALDQKREKIGKKPDRVALVKQQKKKGEKEPQQVQKNLFLLPKLKKTTELELERDPDRGVLENRKDQDQALEGNAQKLALQWQREKQGQQGVDTIGNALNIPESLLPKLSDSADKSGAPMNDYLPKVMEGDSTSLNTRAFKYATFYNRIKRKVSGRWDPVSVQRMYDPTYAIYGYQSRYTIVNVTLDGSGKLEEVTIQRSSGVDYLDEEARSAIARAAPFPNPPSGVIEDDGKIRFPFGFYFEMRRSGIGLQH